VPKRLALAIALGVFAADGAAVAATVDIDWYLGITVEEASVTINAGDTVRWTWADEMSHSVTGPGFDSGILTGLGTTFSHTFEEAGSGGGYVCFVHGFSMQGAITVVEAPSVPALRGAWPARCCALVLAIGARACSRRRPEGD
jgi:plastocyanin